MLDGFTNGTAAADMERIFGSLSNRTPATATVHGRDANLKSTEHKRRMITFAAPALVIIAAAGMSIAYVTSEGERTTTATTRSQITPKHNAALPQHVPTEAPDSSDQIHALVVPEDSSLPEGQVVRTPESSANSRAAATTPSRRAIISPALDTAGKSRADANPSPPRPAGTVPKAMDRRDGLANQPRCTPGSTEDRCIYQDVLNADARLRTAFDNARRTGVSNAQLATIRARWNAARRDADDDPDGTIWQYNRLATALDRMARSGPE